MSGGRWDYCQFRIEEYLEEISESERIQKRFPKLSKIYFKLSRLLCNNIHDLDWDLSGDSTIKNDKDFEKDFIEKLRKITENE